MAHAERDLQRVGSYNLPTAGSTISHFVLGTTDNAAAVETAGYLNASRHKLAVNDFVTAHIGGPTVKGYRVATVPATGDVTIAVVYEPPAVPPA